jgi:hypothetical protein
MELTTKNNLNNFFLKLKNTVLFERSIDKDINYNPVFSHNMMASGC